MLSVFCWFAVGWRHRRSVKSPPWSFATATPTSSSYMKSTTIRWGWVQVSDCGACKTWICCGNGRRQIDVEARYPPARSHLLRLSFFKVSAKQTPVSFISDLFVSLMMLHVQHKCVWSLSLVMGKVLAGSLTLTLQIKEHHFSLMSLAGLLLYLRDLWPRSAQSSLCFTDPALMRSLSVAQACYFVSHPFLPSVVWCHSILVSKHFISVAVCSVYTNFTLRIEARSEWSKGIYICSLCVYLP